jgi:hypothetical protein
LGHLWLLFVFHVFSGSSLYLFIEGHDIPAIVEDGLVGVIRATLTCANLWEVRGGNNLDQVLVVESEDLARNVLNSGVNKVETIFPRVNVSNDSIVHVDESVLGHLHTCEKTVEQLNLIHLVAA